MLALKWKEGAFLEKLNTRCFCWFLAAILVWENLMHIWRLHTKHYNGAWNVSANNSETVGHIDLRLGQMYITLLQSFIFLSSSTGWFPIFFCAMFIVSQWKRSIVITLKGMMLHLPHPILRSEKLLVWIVFPGLKSRILTFSKFNLQATEAIVLEPESNLHWVKFNKVSWPLVALPLYWQTNS